MSNMDTFSLEEDEDFANIFITQEPSNEVSVIVFLMEKVMNFGFRSHGFYIALFVIDQWSSSLF